MAKKSADSSKAKPHPYVHDFSLALKFELDPFQVASCNALAQGNSVLVAAPTGAGKTIVAEFAVYLALKEQQKIFYTAPMKALSNQKYHELVAQYGPEQVGLLTGDTNINASAQIVVMTTEVLRNMIYADSELLSGLGWVVMDEVHYLADRFRGAVWEEIIIHLAIEVRLVALSATVSNAEEFGDWLATVRGKTEVIVSEQRPIPLNQHILIKNQLVELFSKPQVLNPELNQLIRINRGRRVPKYYQRQHGHRVNRAEICELLDDAKLLPAIFFIFSRAGCDAAVRQILHDNIYFTSPAEREIIRSVAEQKCASILDEDLSVLGYWEWFEALQRGIAAHHAGMLPVFKETVEELFQRKLLKVVFATETLALGINMPARTVVLEKLEKFNGLTRVPITPGEYTQLTGRAGRRGIDTEGHSVIQWVEGMNVQAVAALASKRSYPLNSSFKPTYNMAVNLIDQFGVSRSRQLLESSFAQFQADRSVVELAKTIRQQEESLIGFENAMNCHLGDFNEYARIRRELTDLERKKTSGLSKADISRRQKQLNLLRSELRNHPTHNCPEGETHARWGERYWQLKRKNDRLRAQVARRTDQVARRFDLVNEVLLELGYLKAESFGLVSSEQGRILKQIYGERDLLVAECLRAQHWADLDPGALAAMASTMVFEPRRERNQYAAKIPRGAFPAALEKTMQTWSKLDDLELEHQIGDSVPPSAELAYPIFRWANGYSLDRVLSDTDLAAGDFVRWCKQIIDLLDQLQQIAPAPVKGNARKAIDLIFRGIVAYSAV